MFRVFIGEHENKIDSKARLSIPADFRRILEAGDPEWDSGRNASMVIVYGDEKRDFLEVFTRNDLMKVLAKINRMSPGSFQRLALEELYFTKVQPATLDETGRIVLSAKLRDKLGLEGGAMIIGAGATFKIWKPETYASLAGQRLLAVDGFDPSVDASIYLPGDDG